MMAPNCSQAHSASVRVDAVIGHCPLCAKLSTKIVTHKRRHYEGLVFSTMYHYRACIFNHAYSHIQQMRFRQTAQTPRAQHTQQHDDENTRTQKTLFHFSVASQSVAVPRGLHSRMMRTQVFSGPVCVYVNRSFANKRLAVNTLALLQYTHMPICNEEACLAINTLRLRCKGLLTCYQVHVL